MRSLCMKLKFVNTLNSYDYDYDIFINLHTVHKTPLAYSVHMYWGVEIRLLLQAKKLELKLVFICIINILNLHIIFNGIEIR